MRFPVSTLTNHNRARTPVPVQANFASPIPATVLLLASARVSSLWVCSHYLTLYLFRRLQEWLLLLVGRNTPYNFLAGHKDQCLCQLLSPDILPV